MRATLTIMQVLSLLIALPVLAEDVGLHNSSAQPTRATQREHILGVCDVVNLLGSGQVELFPTINANNYFKINGNNIDFIEFATAKISIIQQPNHGVLAPLMSDGDWRDAGYLPNDGYFGNDSFVIQVEGNGYKVKLHYFMVVTNDMGVKSNSDPVCQGDNGQNYWKISQDANGNSILIAINYQSPTTNVTGSSVVGTTALASTLGSSLLSNLVGDTSKITGDRPRFMNFS